MLKLRSTVNKLRKEQTIFQRVLKSLFSNGRFRQPHQILGVTRNASDGQVKAAYYKLAKIHHPDINKEGDSKDNFTQINQAYQKMKNRAENYVIHQNIKQPKKSQRKKASQYQWDSYGQPFEEQDVNWSEFSRYTQQNDHYQYFKGKKTSKNQFKQQEAFGHFERLNQEQLSKIFHQFIHYGKIKGKFGQTYQRIFQDLFDLDRNQQQQANGRRAKSKKARKPEPEHEQKETKKQQQQTYQRQKAQNKKKQKEKEKNGNKNRLDINIQIKLDLFQATKGGKKLVKLVRKILCQSCDGKAKYSRQQCLGCQGSGYFVRHTINKRGDNQFLINDCRQCQGRGVRKISQCQVCNGKNYVEKRSQQMINIPQCTQNKSVLKLKGRGHQQRKKGIFGDLIVKFIIEQKCHEYTD